MKIHGKKNKDLKVYEAIYGLSYTGKDHFRLYNEKMELLASQQGDSLCTFDKQNKSFCSPAQNIMLDLRIIHNFDKKRKLTLFIQINDEPAEAYTFKRRRVKATEEHHEQKYIQGWNICYEAE